MTRPSFCFWRYTADDWFAAWVILASAAIVAGGTFAVVYGPGHLECPLAICECPTESTPEL